MREKVEEALARIRPRLGSADIQLVDVNGGMVTVQHFRQLSACDVRTRGPITKDLILEMLEEELKKEVPEIKGVIVV